MTFLHDNLRNHVHQSVTDTIHAAGHKVVARPPYYPCDGTIEHFLTALRWPFGPMEEMWILMENLCNCCNIIAGIYSNAAETFCFSKIVTTWCFPAWPCCPWPSWRRTSLNSWRGSGTDVAALDKMANDRSRLYPLIPFDDQSDGCDFDHSEIVFDILVVSSRHSTVFF